MKTCKTCQYFLGLGDFCLCCEHHPWLYYEDSPACEDWEPKETKKQAD